MGGEFGQWHEWNHDGQLQWELLQWRSHEGLKKLVADLNQLYCNFPALFEQDFQPEGFQWIDCHDSDRSVVSYLRCGSRPDDILLVCCNFTPVVRHQFPIGVPVRGWYQEIFNSDSEYYGGSNVGNYPGVESRGVGCHGRPFSLRITLPPLAAVVFQPQS